MDCMNTEHGSTPRKLPDDVLVSDPDAAMQRTIAATRGAMSIPKSKIDAMLAKEKTTKNRRK
jgi:hypothetical protein